MTHLFDKLIASAILGIFLWTTGVAVHNLYEIHGTLDRAEQILHQDTKIQDKRILMELDLARLE